MKTPHCALSMWSMSADCSEGMQGLLQVQQPDWVVKKPWNMREATAYKDWDSILSTIICLQTGSYQYRRSLVTTKSDRRNRGKTKIAQHSYFCITLCILMWNELDTLEHKLVPLYTGPLFVLAVNFHKWTDWYLFYWHVLGFRFHIMLRYSSTALQKW